MQEGYYFWSSGDSEWKLLYSGNVPSVPGNTVYWVRPSGQSYIQPEGNDYIHIYDANQTYGIYYDGSTNQYGVWSQTGNTSNPTAAVVGFSNVSGNQTYGYLGYNGTWSAPAYTSSYQFGDVYGMAVYGIVDDPDRVAGFFRTTANATFAANIAYSDVWIAGYYYIDNYDDTYAARPALYGQSVVSCDQSGYQSAFQGYSVMDVNCSNKGYTAGGVFYAIGEGPDVSSNQGQDAKGIYAVATTGSSLTAWGAYCRGDDYN